MKKTFFYLVLFIGVLLQGSLFAYPPAVGITGKAKSCLVCHVSNGPWKNDQNLIIDLVDKGTGKSLKQADGSFLVAVKPKETLEVITVIGTTRDGDVASHRNAWLYVNPTTLAEKDSEEWFGPGWWVNLPLSCRLVGDSLPAYPDAKITALPMLIRAHENAKDSQLQLQVMLTKGDAVKGKPKEGTIGSYFERIVNLKVLGKGQEQK